jgi:hypothetical protein
LVVAHGNEFGGVQAKVVDGGHAGSLPILSFNHHRTRSLVRAHARHIVKIRTHLFIVNGQQKAVD